MLSFLNRGLSFYSGKKIWRIGSNSLLRRLHQESPTLLNEHDLKCFERNVHLFSATLRYGCPAPGQSLSSVYMPVRIGPPIPIEVLSPSLVQFVKDASYGHKFEGVFGQAFDALARGLAMLSDTETKSGLSHYFCKVTNKMARLRGECSEIESNAELAENVILSLIEGFIILNASHDDITVRDDCIPLYSPEIKGWKGLGMGHPNAWYGEIDMLICNAIKPGDCQVAVITEDSDNADCDPEDSNRLPEASLAEEGEKAMPRDRSFLDGQFGQGFATAVTYSFVYHYGHSFKASLVPTIQVSPGGFQVFLYDCRSDVMLAQSFLWQRSSLIFLWAILHHFLFFPPSISTNSTGSIFAFGYGYRTGGFDTVGGFHGLKKDQFHFGLHKNSKLFRKKHSQLGRHVDTYM